MHRINPTTLLILPLALALMLGAAPRQAEAQACKNLKGVSNMGCVTSEDVKDGDLSHNDVKNIAGQRSVRLGSEGMAVPTAGWVIVSATARLDASGAGGPVTMKCKIVPKGGGVVAPTPYRVEESLNPDEGFALAYIEATTVYEVIFQMRDTVRFNFKCAQNPAVKRKVISLTARFVPTRYTAKRP